MKRLIDIIRFSFFIAGLIIAGLAKDIISFFKYLIKKIKNY